MALTALPGLPQSAAPTFSGSYQSGLAETFQLTLGGTFGRGPAWQNRLTLGVNNVFAKGDAVQVYGQTTLDTPTAHLDWQTGIQYRRPLLNRKRMRLTGTLGYQHWFFPHVLCGTDDHLMYANVLTATRIAKIPVTLNVDSWRLLSSPERLGTVLNPQLWTTHVLWHHEPYRLTLKPTVATTYSWHFWNRDGHRVFRYGAALGFESTHYSIEASVRRQVALLPNIPENTFYLFALTRSF